MTNGNINKIHYLDLPAVVVLNIFHILCQIFLSDALTWVDLVSWPQYKVLRDTVGNIWYNEEHSPGVISTWYQQIPSYLLLSSTNNSNISLNSHFTYHRWNTKDYRGHQFWYISKNIEAQDNWSYWVIKSKYKHKCYMKCRFQNRMYQT